MIEILILGNTSSTESIVSILAEADLEFNWHQASNLAQCSQISSQISNPIDLVIYDAKFEEITLKQAIAFASASDRPIPILVVNGESNIPAAVAAIKAGAIDYLASEALSQLPQAVIKALSEPDYLCLQSRCEIHSDATHSPYRGKVPSERWGVSPVRRKAQGNAHQDSDRQLQKLISENPDGIIVVGERGTVQFVNPAAIKLLGKSSAELFGQALGFPVVNGDYLEVDIPLSQDKILVAQMRVSQIHWQGKNAYVVSLRDITQLKQAEEERAKLLDEAQAANRAKDEFLAILSHELRTPLNPIIGWSQLLVRGGLSEAQVKRGAETIQRNAMLQTELIGDILDISSIIQGKLKLQICPVNLASIISNALDTVNLAAQAKSIQIQSDLKEIGLVKGDPTRLQQVVWNLLSNAVKFTPIGGTVEIKLSLKQNEFVSHAQIQVIDSGKGIAPEFLPYVFDYFRQAESTKSRSEGGLGLGLAIVHRLVELHGGEITANSQGLGEGATFTISLPISTDSPATAESLTAPLENNLMYRKVLVVDDDDDSRNLICFILETRGAEVNAARSAIEALSTVEEFEPDILISDIGMPQMNGYELIQRIRQLDRNTLASVKAIAISGYASEEDRQVSLSAGFDYHLNKPIDLGSLMKAIEN